jgi:hypothetical protein
MHSDTADAGVNYSGKLRACYGGYDISSEINYYINIMITD